jgi:hypothetical protein
MKEKKRYTVFHVPVLAFFSKELYRDVALRWKGTAFGCLLLLLAVCWVPGMINIHTGVVEFVANEAPKLVSQIPVVTIVDGQASIDEPQPYYILDPDSGEALIVIDTTGNITSLEETEAQALLTRTGAIYRKSAIETRSFSFSEIDRFVLTQDRIYGWLDMVKRYAAPVLYPFCVLGSFIFRILQALLYAAIGLLIARLLKTERSYDDLLRLSVVAVTPAIIAVTLLDLAGIVLPFAGLWFFLAAMGYLTFGIRSAAARKEPAFNFSPPPPNSPGPGQMS